MVSIYVLRNNINGRVYVGSTVIVVSRFSKHRRMLSNGNHRNRLLQQDYNENKSDIYSYEVIERDVSLESRFIREQYWMDHYKNHGGIYNILPIAGSARGRKYTKETLRKMSLAAQGRVISEQQKELLRSINTGKKASSETRELMSRSQNRINRKGERSSSAKLTRAQAEEIIRLILSGERQVDVAAKFNMSKTAVGHIWHGRTWRDLQTIKHRQEGASL